MSILFLALLLVLALVGCGGTQSAPQSSSDLTLDQALTQIDSLPTPEGMSAQGFASLQSALADSLVSSGKSRFASAIPGGNASLVDDLVLAPTGSNQYKLSWTYKNKGDYDQNSETNIADLTTLGVNLGKNTSSPDWVTKAVAADGDLNGEVNISDITPIGANFLGRVDGYVIEASTDPSNEASWTQVGTIDFASADASQSGPFKTFSFNVAQPGTATSFRVKAVNGADQGPASNEVAFDPSQIPDIQSVDPTGGDSGTQHQFSAVITGGTPDTYLWNFGGGATPNTSSEESPSVTLGAAGNYNASLKVSNSFGSDSFNFSLDVTVAGGVHINSVSPTTGETGQQVQITADITGTPDTWMWVFNQAASPSVSTNESPTMTLNTPGTYNCSLTATDSVSGQSDTFDFQFTVTPSTQPPDVTDVQPQGGSTGATVQLTPTVGGGPGPYTYAWDFGGGANPNTSTDPAPTVILGATGSYNAKVIVSNVNGSDEYDFPLDVVDLPPPPHVVDVQPTSAEAGSTFTFSTTLSGGTPTSYLWTFPNSLFTVDSSTDPEPTVTCNGMNIANCTLHVENAGGSEDYNFIFSVYFGP